ncbi:PREDICTED: uncharacterized protein LOC104600024 [Nelumbo nucifera]|uniref:Uncharacterized protein LOC104600024 n=2 Tax=Nelumbo nucifera TaxID=4432 RepID=A0A1U8AGM0_NELNU|nr:PREDICTED: uncharacterized protein LOC104600024 [Nelumbo nucifera]DAD40196.1 TPA_asm: hypothetical protein HUJ06_014519 [Nelumbo nucifera]
MEEERDSADEGGTMIYNLLRPYRFLQSVITSLLNCLGFHSAISTAELLQSSSSSPTIEGAQENNLSCPDSLEKVRKSTVTTVVNSRDATNFMMLTVADRRPQPPPIESGRGPQTNHNTATVAA